MRAQRTPSIPALLGVPVMRGDPGRQARAPSEAWFAREQLADWYIDAYGSNSAVGHLFATRLREIERLLSDCEGGALLDAGCGPGMVSRYLMERRPGRFRFVGLDQSAAMIDAARRNLAGRADVELRVGSVEALPFPDATFDVVLAIGVIEYVDAPAALRELSRVARPGAIVITSMLNPTSPYRLWQRRIYEPFWRAWAAIRGDTQALPTLRLMRSRPFRRLLEASRLSATQIVYYDFNVLPPPLDRRFSNLSVRLNRVLARRGRWVRWFGTGYLVKARKA